MAVRKAKIANAAADDAVLRRWATARKQFALDELGLRRNEHLDSALMPLPLPGEHAFMHDSLVPRLVGKIGRVVHAKKTKDSLLPCILQDWEDKHSIIFDADCPVMDDPKEAKGKTYLDTIPPCCTLGFCVCGDDGRKLAHLRHRFLNMMSLKFKPK